MAEQDGVTPEETEVSVEGEEEDGEEFHPFDELFSEYNPSQVTQVMAEDGLPTQDASVVDSNIPPLSTETLVCMGDFSKFVIRSPSGRVTRELESSTEVKQMPDGTYCYEEGPGKFQVDVEPIRPPCRHYVRQLGQAGDNPELKMIYRLCSARRTTEGAFMSVRDTGIWACSMREPRDLESEKRHLDLFDERKIREGAQRTASSIFKKEL